MKLSEDNINELKQIIRYLDSFNPEIVMLEYTLYKTKYEERFNETIKNIECFPYKWIGVNTTEDMVTYECDLHLGIYTTFYRTSLSWAINFMIEDYYAYGIN